MAKVIWLPDARADVERLYDFVHEHSPQAAARAARSILDGAQLLAESPRLGQLMENDHARRELPLPFSAGAYVLRYRLNDNGDVVIIRVWHSREDH